MQTSEISPISIEDSFNYCERIAKEHYENFPVGSFLIPKAKRKYVWSIYAFARYADDIADSPELSEEYKLKELITLDNELLLAYSGDFTGIREKTRTFFKSLWKTKEDLQIPKQEFSDLLTAFKQDAVKQRYDSFNELLEYSKYSANPIGHLVLYVFDYKPEEKPELFGYSDRICTALQLTNFWQDVSVDLKMERVYIPDEIMRKYNYTYDDLTAKKENMDFTAIMKELCNKTRELFEKGKPLIKHLKGRLKLEIKATYLGGNLILDKIEQRDYKVITKRVKISKADTGTLFLKMLFGGTG